jgi:hypothetical protein
MLLIPYVIVLQSSSALESFEYAGKIGEGEYGEVHLMRDNAGKEYALKIMEATEQDCQYIIAEALLWKRVDSCTVARLYDAFSIGPLCFFLLELGGITLDVWLQKKVRPVPLLFALPTITSYHGQMCCMALSSRAKHGSHDQPYF